MKVLLLHTPKRHQVWAGVPSVFNDRFAYVFPPLAVMYLSSYLKKNTHHHVDVLDCIPKDLGFSYISEYVKRTRPDVVGISITATHNLVNIVKSIDAIRLAKPDVFIVIGGAHVNSFPEQATRLKGVDAAIFGDGEIPLTALLDALESGSDIKQVPNILLFEKDGALFRGARMPNEDDLDVFPFPDRVACPPGKYFTPGMKGARATTMMSSRGCPFQCVFCNVPHSFRTRSATNVVDEIEECVNQYGIQDIQFIDDIFNITPERVMEISEEILRRNVKVWWGYKASVRQTNREMIRLAKKAGCYRMHYGVETFTRKGLKALNKKVTLEEIFEIFWITQEEKVKAIAYMIVGCPFEKTADEILQADRFIRKLKPNYVVYSLFTPYPDAPVFQQGVDKGLWEADCWEKFMADPSENHFLPTAWEEHLSKKELLDVFKKLNRQFYFHPSTLARTFLSIRSWAELKRILLGGLSLIRMELLKAGSQDI